MFLYLFLFIALAGIYKLTYRGSGCDKRLFFFIVLALGLFVGLSDMLGGYDRYIYAEYFDQVADVGKTSMHDYLNEAQIFSHWEGEKGYGWLNVAISLFTSNRYIFILVFTLIVYGLLFVSISEYTDDNLMELMVFMGLLFFFTYTYLRQVMGFSVGWLAIRYAYRRSFWKFTLIVLLAYSMHNSAVVLFPFYFIPVKKYPKGVVITVLIVCLFLGALGVANFFYDTYSDAADDSRGESLNESTGSLRPGYLIEAVIFAVLILRNYEYVLDTKRHILLMNVGLFFCCVLLLFIRSENGGRLSWYYAIGIMATLANIAAQKHRVNATPQSISLSGFHLFLIGLSFFLYFRILRGWGEGGYQILYPYKTFLTNGHRDPDRTYDEYEYDYRYDKDKFYR